MQTINVIASKPDISWLAFKGLRKDMERLRGPMVRFCTNCACLGHKDVLNAKSIFDVAAPIPETIS
jgi:hypothetical protein